MTAPLFPLGRVVATPGALSALEEAGVDALGLLRRHAAGDWGEVPPEDRRENVKSLKHGWRLLSSYPVGEAGRTVWIITESTRELTTLLLAEEY